MKCWLWLRCSVIALLYGGDQLQTSSGTGSRPEWRDADSTGAQGDNTKYWVDKLRTSYVQPVEQACDAWRSCRQCFPGHVKATLGTNAAQ